MESYCFVQRKRETEKKEIDCAYRGIELGYLIKR